MLTLALMVPAVAFSQYSNPTAVPLGTAVTYGALAYSGIPGGTFNVDGDIGTSTATISATITCTGTKHAVGDAPTLQAQTDLANALDTALNSRPVDQVITGDILGGLTLQRGVYGGGALALAEGATLTLDAQSDPNAVFIIKASSTLTINTTSNVSLINGAEWSNVFWYVGTAATISGTTFKGIILAGTSITLNAGVTVHGQLLANTGAVTINSNVLPVELVAFTATPNGMNADLHWSTATEANNYGFEIERRQTAQWEKGGFVPGAGTSSSPRDYSYTDNNLSPGRYAYRIKQVDINGTFSYHGSAEVEIGSAAKKFELASNYPNPFNPSTTIQFTLGDDGLTSLTVYNMLGQKVTTLFDGNAKAGRLYQVKFDASSLPGGFYVAKLESGKRQMMQKMVLVK